VVVQPHTEILFQQSDSGLYYHNTTDCAMVMVNTVGKNREGFTNRAYNRAKQARRALGMVGYPSEKDFRNMVSSNMITNCPVAPTDINADNKIFGPNVASLKVKTVRVTQYPVLTSYVKVPQEIVDINKEITITADVIIVDGLRFMITSSRGVKFTTSEYIPTQSKANLTNSLKKLFEIYTHGGFTIQTALMDREFECLQDDLRGVTLNTTVASEHVQAIERQIHVVKERARAIWSTLPFNRVSNRIIVELINFVVLWLNAPPSSGISQTYSPRTIMTGITLDYKKHCRLLFGAYVETHGDNKPSNTLKERTRAAICLGPTANFQGSYKFLCLRTGRRIARKQFQELPMPASIIEAVEALADRDKQTGTMEFTDRDGNTYDNLDDTSQPIDGVAGVDIGDEAQHDEQEQEQEEENDNEPTDSNGEAPSIMLETPGVPETAVMEPEIPGVDLDNLEIPGVDPEGVEPP
jgi:hypothetical protein